MSESNLAPLHINDLIRKKRDGGSLNEREIQFLVQAASAQNPPVDQLAAWLMASWIRGLSLPEIERFQVLSEWLSLDMSFLTNRSSLADEAAYKGPERRAKAVALSPMETFLLKSFRETDARGKHCLINLAKSLHERPDPTI